MPKPHQKRVIERIEDLSKNPFLGKPLKGELKGLWSLRIGEYRVIYTIDKSNKEVRIYVIGHRKKVYK